MARYGRTLLKAHTGKTVAASGLTNYTLSAAAGSCALTGSAVTLKATRLLTASAGAYALTGSAATLKATRLLALAAGSVVVSGMSATLNGVRTLGPSAGAFTVTGSAAALKTTRTLSAAAGSVLVTGSAATLSSTTLTHYVLTASAGSVTLTGDAATGLLVSAPTPTVGGGGGGGGGGVYWQGGARKKRRDLNKEIDELVGQVAREMVQADEAVELTAPTAAIAKPVSPRPSPWATLKIDPAAMEQMARLKADLLEAHAQEQEEEELLLLHLV